MAGVDITYDFSELAELARVLNIAASVPSRRDVLDQVGAIVESASRRRIQIEKQSPDGTAWPKWSKRYAKTRHSGQSLLSSEGYLLDSIQHEVDGDDLLVGSNLIYAAIHQKGGKAGRKHKAIIPAREYIGISKQDKRDIEKPFIEAFEGVLNG